MGSSDAYKNTMLDSEALEETNRSVRTIRINLDLNKKNIHASL